MLWFQRYLFSILCAALICSILKSITKESFFHRQMALLCGVFLTSTITAPLLQLSIPSIDDFLQPIQNEAEEISSAGTKASDDLYAQVLMEEVSAYIINSAEELHCAVSVELELTADHPPAAEYITLTGKYDAQSKQLLEERIAADLGIPKERQKWIGTN